MRHWWLALAVSVLVSTTGCASGISTWIVQTRNHQGDVALEHGNSADASIAYQLALRVDPKNVHARAGLVGVQARIARTGYTGEDGFEIYVPPAEAPRLWDEIFAAGEEFGNPPCGRRLLRSVGVVRVEEQVGIDDGHRCCSPSPYSRSDSMLS